MFACLRHAVLDHGFTVRWTDGIRMFHTIKSAIATNQAEQEIARFCKPLILGISDPTPPRAELSDYEISCLRDIIDRRYSNCLSTWITTNVVSSDEANTRLTGPLLSRLADRAVEVRCDWPCYRNLSTFDGPERVEDPA